MEPTVIAAVIAGTGIVVGIVQKLIDKLWSSDKSRVDKLEERMAKLEGLVTELTIEIKVLVAQLKKEG